jgi:hypothetical protein
MKNVKDFLEKNNLPETLSGGTLQWAMNEFAKLNVTEYIDNQLKTLDRGFVATPATANVLEAFARANGGSMDIILMQMAIQYGYKQALENVMEAIGE